MSVAAVGTTVSKVLAGIAISSGEGPLSRAGTQFANRLLPNAIPNAQSILQYYKTKNLETDAAYEFGLNNGIYVPKFRTAKHEFDYKPSGRLRLSKTYAPTSNPYQAALWDAEWYPDLDFTRNLLWRRVITPQTAKLFLDRLPITGEAEKQAYIEAGRPIPSPQSLLQMSLRQAFIRTNDYNNILLAEYPYDYDLWASTSGLGPVRLPANQPFEKDVEVDFRKSLWAMHWKLPDIHQAITWMRRFRLDAFDGRTPRDQSGVVFDPKYLTSILQQNNVHPFWRPFVVASSLKPVPMRHAATLYNSNAIDEKELLEICLDNGYNDRSAEQISTGIINRKVKLDNREIVSQSRGFVEDAWDLGIIADNEYTNYITSLGYSQQQAETALGFANLRRQSQRTKRVTATIKRQFLSGKIDEQQARTLLSESGIYNNRIDEYLVDWNLQIQGQIPAQSVSKMLTYAEDGLMSAEDFDNRLTNLRYTDRDRSMILGELQLKLAARQAKALVKLATEEKRRQRELIRAQKEASKAQSIARTELARHGTVAQLKKWVCLGLIGEQEATARLHVLGWPDVDIKRLLAECVLAAQKKAQDAANKQSSSGSKNGTAKGK